jgi:hypothetical protein
MAKGCSRVFLFVVAGAALNVLSASRLQDNYQLGVQSELFTEALVANRGRDLYALFCPEFRTQNTYARFDSALNGWYRGRRIRKASRRVEEVSGIGGHVSTWVVFEGARDYEYLFQSWLRVGSQWQLVWVTRVLDKSFEYGRSDTAQSRLVTEAALRYALSPAGLNRFRRNFRRPDTLLMLEHAAGEARLARVDQTPLVWLSAEELRALGPRRRPQFVMAISGLRVVGDVAVVMIDVVPGNKADFGRFGSNRGQQIYLMRRKGQWVFHSVGKAW